MKPTCGAMTFGAKARALFLDVEDQLHPWVGTHIATGPYFVLALLQSLDVLALICRHALDLPLDVVDCS